MIKSDKGFSSLQVIAALCSLSLFLSIGCAANRNVVTAESQFVINSGTGDIVLGPGDTIEIKFLYTPEFNEIQAVRPDGKISLPLVGEIIVQGKTPGEVKKELTEKFKGQLKNSDITVVVRTLVSQRIYIGGEVTNPGFLDAPRRISTLEAVMEAGGFNSHTAQLKNVLVIRHEENKRRNFIVNLEKALSGAEQTPFMLEPFDIVFVPKTKIAKVNQWVDQYIDGIVPDTVLSVIPLWTQYMMFREYQELVDTLSENDDNGGNQSIETEFQEESQ